MKAMPSIRPIAFQSANSCAYSHENRRSSHTCALILCPWKRHRSHIRLLLRNHVSSKPPDRNFRCARRCLGTGRVTTRWQIVAHFLERNAHASPVKKRLLTRKEIYWKRKQPSRCNRPDAIAPCSKMKLQLSGYRGSLLFRCADRWASQAKKVRGITISKTQANAIYGIMFRKGRIR